MAKKDMDALLGNILGSAIIRPQDKCEETKQEANEKKRPGEQQQKQAKYARNLLKPRGNISHSSVP